MQKGQLADSKKSKLYTKSYAPLRSLSDVLWQVIIRLQRQARELSVWVEKWTHLGSIEGSSGGVGRSGRDAMGLAMDAVTGL